MPGTARYDNSRSSRASSCTNFYWKR